MVPAWVEWVPTLLAAAGLVWLYRKSSPDEPHRGWKLIGYAALGAFSFRFPEFSFPLGFLICLMLLARAKPNVRAKRGAAIAGLAIFAAGIAIPSLDQRLFERERSFAVQSGQAERLDLAGDWRRIAGGGESTDERLDRFQLVQEPDGRIRSLQYQVTARDSKGDYTIEVRYEPESGQAIVERTRLGSLNEEAAFSFASGSSGVYRIDPERFLQLLSPDNLERMTMEAASGPAKLRELELLLFNGPAGPVEPSPIRRLLQADGIKPAGEEPVHGYILQARGKTDSEQGKEDKFVWHVIPTQDVQPG
ncbi:hypothetical protein ACTHPH_04385 [Paenibacillus pasadenensis]|uniref:hypothetical protein n=1 Tax=Paenibacillus pasadenensis TaxID=217090 RepID=UPI0004197677|nr:hypothetical protein [Paenibacillus pasadenensis]